MALDLSLRRFSLLPSFIQTGNGEPRKAHYLRRSEEPSVDRQQQPGGQNDDSPKPPDTRRYRSLSELTLGEVEDALAYFHPQLVASPAEEWLARNYFAQIPLQRTFEDRPSVVFGRIRSCYPSAGDLENIEEMEVYFPNRNTAPDLLHIRYIDVSQKKPIQSFCIGVKMYLSEREQMEFSDAERGFLENGFAPLYETGYGDLLDLSERDRPVLPWVYVFGSEWFATVTDFMQVEVKQQIQKLLHWNRLVLNFHPRKYLLQYRSLNDELEFNYGYTEHFLLTPQDTEQVLIKVDEKFGEMFMKGMK
jgi:hypothetical protein